MIVLGMRLSCYLPSFRIGMKWLPRFLPVTSCYLLSLIGTGIMAEEKLPESSASLCVSASSLLFVKQNSQKAKSLCRNLKKYTRLSSISPGDFSALIVRNTQADCHRTERISPGDFSALIVRNTQGDCHGTERIQVEHRQWQGKRSPSSCEILLSKRAWRLGDCLNCRLVCIRRISSRDKSFNTLAGKQLGFLLRSSTVNLNLPS